MAVAGSRNPNVECRGPEKAGSPKKPSCFGSDFGFPVSDFPQSGPLGKMIQASVRPAQNSSKKNLHPTEKRQKIMTMNPIEKQFSVTPGGSKNNFLPATVGRALRRPTNRIGRRAFLKSVGALGLAGMASPLVATGRTSLPIQHVIIDM